MISFVLLISCVLTLSTAVPYEKPVVDLTKLRGPQVDGLPNMSGRCTPGGPCAFDDAECMTAVATVYINEWRAAHGKAPLTGCARPQLDNALKHNDAMFDKGMFHQDFSKISLGCGANLSGENIAANWCDPFPGGADPARTCVNQLSFSPGHAKQMLYGHHNACMGVTVTNIGQIMCTMTFAYNTEFTASGLCKEITTDVNPSDLTPPLYGWPSTVPVESAFPRKGYYSPRGPYNSAGPSPSAAPVPIESPAPRPSIMLRVDLGMSITPRPSKAEEDVGELDAKASSLPLEEEEPSTQDSMPSPKVDAGPDPCAKYKKSFTHMNILFTASGKAGKCKYCAGVLCFGARGVSGMNLKK